MRRLALVVLVGLAAHGVCPLGVQAPTTVTQIAASWHILALLCDDLHNVRRVRWTVSNGRMYESAALWKSVRFVP
jgi:hypothetical protein